MMSCLFNEIIGYVNYGYKRLLTLTELWFKLNFGGVNHNQETKLALECLQID